MTAASPVLIARGLEITSGQSGAIRVLVRGVDLAVQPGELLALVGPSGSGKSLILKSFLGVLPSALGCRADVLEANGHDLLARRARRPAPRGLGWVPQDVARAFTPHLRVGLQCVEALRAGGEGSRASRREAVLTAFEDLGFHAPRRVFDALPHTLSGGETQRALLAMALLGRPKALLLDEPTACLDGIAAARVRAAIDRARTSTGAAVLLVAHDLGVAAGWADRLAFIEDGRAERVGEPSAVLAAVGSDRARALVAAWQTLDGGGTP